jgi:hypothetical protein
MLAELSRRPTNDKTTDREGNTSAHSNCFTRSACGDLIPPPPPNHVITICDQIALSLSAGLALGMITLGRGSDAAGLLDLQLENQLCHYMIGGRIDELKSIGLPLSSLHDGDNANKLSRSKEGEFVNIDVSSPGATLALAMMFMKTNNSGVAARISLPSTHYALDYVRPDFTMLRVLARSIIMWDHVIPSSRWIQSQVPQLFHTHVDVSVMAFPLDNNDTSAASTVAATKSIPTKSTNILSATTQPHKRPTRKHNDDSDDEDNTDSRIARLAAELATSTETPLRPTSSNYSTPSVTIAAGVAAKREMKQREEKRPTRQVRELKTSIATSTHHDNNDDDFDIDDLFEGTFLEKKQVSKKALESSSSSSKSGAPPLRVNSISHMGNEEIDYEALRQGYCNMIAGACLAMGLRYAGTADIKAKQTLSIYVRAFRRIRMKHQLSSTGSNDQRLIEKVDKTTLEVMYPNH